VRGAPAAAYRGLSGAGRRGLARRGQLISSFLDGLAARNATAITRADVVAFATAPTGTGRAWRAFRLSTIRPFASYAHGLDPDAAEVISARLLPATHSRRIPYLYSVAQISDLMTASTMLLPPPLNATVTAFNGQGGATGMRSGEAISLDTEDLAPEQGLLTVTGKYGRQRVLPLHPSTVTALTDYRQARAGMTPTPHQPAPARTSPHQPAPARPGTAPRTRPRRPLACPHRRTSEYLRFSCLGSYWMAYSGNHD
jgi:site-specific recombinase XerD